MSSFSRRDALKLGGMALASLAARPLDEFILPVESPNQAHSGRVCTTTINVYREPAFSSECIGERHRDQLLSLLEEIIASSGPSHNPRWYRINSGYVHSGYIQPVQLHATNEPLTTIPPNGILGEVSVPYTRTMRYVRPSSWEELYRLYYQSIHWITGIIRGPDGQAWYRLKDHYIGYNYYVAATHLRPVNPTQYQPIAKDVPPQEKEIHVSLEAQQLTAYEGGQVVMECPVSTGRLSPDNLPEGIIPTDTPSGSFFVQTKMPSRHMGRGWLTSNIYAYELPGVPWTMVFTETGVAFHGTYWHDNFGTRMSSGCVNMRNPDALWLFRWANPVYESSSYYKRVTGTRVVVS
jgi:hypothetical protein